MNSKLIEYKHSCTRKYVRTLSKAFSISFEVKLFSVGCKIAFDLTREGEGAFLSLIRKTRAKHDLCVFFKVFIYHLHFIWYKNIIIQVHNDKRGELAY